MRGTQNEGLFLVLTWNRKINNDTLKNIFSEQMITEQNADLYVIIRREKKSLQNMSRKT